MKVLFLDIDGVLNSRRSAEAFGKFPWDAKPESLPLFDLVALGLIRKVLKDTGAVVVLSSTWRIGRGFDGLAEGLNIPIIDRTPESRDGFRGKEIKAWLDKRPDIATWAIVDDDSDMLEEQKERFVKTDFINGLLYEHYTHLVDILGKTDEERGESTTK